MTILRTLLEITVYSWIIFMVILILKNVLKDRSSTHFQYLIWFVLIARLCIPITFDTGIHLFTIPDFGAKPEDQLQIVEQTDEIIDSDNKDMQINRILDSKERISKIYPKEYVGEQHIFQHSIESKYGPTDRGSIWIQWYQILLIIWILGAITILFCYSMVAYQINRSIKSFVKVPPKGLIALIDECKESLGIRAHIIYYMMEDISTPALTVSLRPKLLLPADIIEKMSDEQIQFALRHELTHYRRKDHIVSLLLRVLEAVYWFNPVVWLLSKRMQMDMEIACDSDVVREMDSLEKGSYAMTILEMFSQGKKPKLVLGMGLSGTRKVAEDRIRGIYTDIHTGIRTRLIAVILTLILVFSCFTTACQPTPEKGVVKSKKDDTFMDSLTGDKKDDDSSNMTISNDRFTDYPRSWSEEIQVKPVNISVNIDADVVTPNVDKLPIYTVLFDKMRQEQVDGFLSMFGDVEYRLNTYIKTKADYEEDILEMQQYIAVELDKREGLTKEQIAGLRREYEDSIERMKRDMQDAPESIDDIIEPVFTDKYLIQESLEPEYFADEEDLADPDSEEYETAEQYYKKTNTEAIDIKWKMGNDDMTFRAYRSDVKYANDLTFDTARQGVFSSSLVKNTSDLEGFDMTYDEARALAEDAVALLGADYLSMSHAAKGVDYTDYDKGKSDEEYVDFNTLEYKDRYYKFYFTREIYGINETYCINGQIYDMRFDEPWNKEILSVEIDDRGLRTLDWKSGGTRLGDKLSEDSELLQLEEIMKIAAGQFEIGNFAFHAKEQFEFENVVDMNLYVDEVVLGYMKIKLSDGSGRYAMIPVWDFFGSYEGTVHYQDRESKYEEKYNIYSDTYGQNYRCSYLTINAIDGSVIDRSLGY